MSEVSLNFEDSKWGKMVTTVEFKAQHTTKNNQEIILQVNVNLSPECSNFKSKCISRKASSLHPFKALSSSEKLCLNNFSTEPRTQKVLRRHEKVAV